MARSLKKPNITKNFSPFPITKKPWSKEKILNWAKEPENQWLVRLFLMRKVGLSNIDELPEKTKEKIIVREIRKWWNDDKAGNPSAWFRRQINKETRSRQNHELRNFLSHADPIEDDFCLNHVYVKDVRWRWF